MAHKTVSSDDTSTRRKRQVRAQRTDDGNGDVAEADEERGDNVGDLHVLVRLRHVEAGEGEAPEEKQHGDMEAQAHEEVAPRDRLIVQHRIRPRENRKRCGRKQRSR